MLHKLGLFTKVEDLYQGWGDLIFVKGHSQKAIGHYEGCIKKILLNLIYNQRTQGVKVKVMRKCKNRAN